MRKEEIIYTSLEDEFHRMKELHELSILDTLPEEAFDQITRMLSRVFEAPTCLISLVTEDRQWFKSCVGLPEPLQETRSTKREVSFCQYVVAYKQPLIVMNTLEDLRFKNNQLVHDFGIRFYAGVPLISKNGNILGSLCVIDYEERAWSDKDTLLLKELSNWVMSEIDLRQTNRLLEEANQRLYSLSCTDGLTGLYNRRYFDGMFERVSHGLDPVSLLLIDIDYFKIYNDSKGHLLGDDCLKSVARGIHSVIASYKDCFVARYGGEEFVALLKGIDADKAFQIAEEIRLHILSLRIEHGSSAISEYITLSIGIASFTEFPDPADLLGRADQALYVAKEHGRNRVHQALRRENP